MRHKILRLPRILVLHVKRFTIDTKYFRPEKRHDRIVAPLNLSLQQLCRPLVKSPPLRANQSCLQACKAMSMGSPFSNSIGPKTAAREPAGKKRKADQSVRDSFLRRYRSRPRNLLESVTKVVNTRSNSNGKGVLIGSDEEFIQSEEQRQIEEAIRASLDEQDSLYKIQKPSDKVRVAIRSFRSLFVV